MLDPLTLCSVCYAIVCALLLALVIVSVQERTITNQNREIGIEIEI